MCDVTKSLVAGRPLLWGTHMRPRDKYPLLRCCAGQISLAALVASTMGITGASSQSLQDAMLAAYRNNPGLQAQRYQVRVSDEGVPRALSGYRPRVVGDAFYGATSERGVGRGISDGQTYGYGLKIEQPLFDGFQTRNSVLEAKSGVRASRFELLARENEILLQTASAYLDVLRDEGIVLYRRKNMTALKRELVGARERLGRGHGTVTDLEQVRQRLALARSDLAQAGGTLEVSTLRFARVTGATPTDLRMPAVPVTLLPKSRRAATVVALGNSPIIAAARYKYEAAGYAISKVKGELLPSAKLVAGYDRSYNHSTTIGDEDGFSVIGRVRVPFYQGGEVSARVRQARHTALARDREVEDTRLRIGEAVGAAWSELVTARKRERLEVKAIASARRALGGVREEHRVGRRTVLDVLDAERELVNARIRILNTRRDLHVSAYALLRAVGSLTVARIVPDAERYNPKHHYAAVRNKWWGTATPTVAGEAFLKGQERRVGTR